MLVFSQNLNQSLGRAIAQAEQQSYSCATPEHVLLALLDDPDAIPVMQACNVDLEKLRAAVLASMPHWQAAQDLDEADETSDPDEPDDTLADELDDAPTEDESDEAPDEDGRIPVQHFQFDLQRAIAHARTSEREEVNSADVLVAMLDGPAGSLLNEHGITRYDATTFISHRISKDAQTSSLIGAAVDRPASRPRSGDPADSMFKVRFVNDDYTPMDFVRYVLQQVFELDQEDAERLMFEIHREGMSAYGSFTREEAEARAAQVMDLGRQHQHPLRCSVEKSRRPKE